MSKVYGRLTACIYSMRQLGSYPYVCDNGITTTTKRLERTQNFASVNKDLHIFLSEAITYVHQKYASVKSSAWPNNIPLNA
ncbi:hypothetical protein ACTXT7_005494 [Hymenolepis weldensis]